MGTDYTEEVETEIKSPGQIMYEAYWASVITQYPHMVSADLDWDELTDSAKSWHEAAALAVVDHVLTRANYKKSGEVDHV